MKPTGSRGIPLMVTALSVARGGSQGRWGDRPLGPKGCSGDGWMFRVQVVPRTNVRLGQGQKDARNGSGLLP